MRKLRTKFIDKIEDCPETPTHISVPHYSSYPAVSDELARVASNIFAIAVGDRKDEPVTNTDVDNLQPETSSDHYKNY